MIERSETMKLMDRLEELVLRKGWPVPGTPYYLVHHEKMLALMDQLRASLQDEMDGRFIKTFSLQETENPLQQKQMGKERSH